MRAFLEVSARFVAPALLLAAAFGGVYLGAFLPPSLAGLTVYGPYIVLAAAAALAVAFGRGCTLFALLTLALACSARQEWLQTGITTPAARALYLALSLGVPFNLALFAALPERGVFNRHAAWRLALILGEVALTAWLAAPDRSQAVDWAWGRFLPFPFGIGALPQAGAVAAVLGLVAALVAAIVSRSAVSAGCAGAIIAFVVATHVPTATWTFAVFTIAAGLMLAVAMLHDTFRMAFRDALTGLGSRRALDERLAALPRRYAVAMIDLDHFKRFNDAWGHETGDHVLRMVAAQIGNIGGGGKAYRYGGEEFTVVFPGRSAAEAMPHLEALRRRVETYELALRSPERLSRGSRGVRQPGGWKGKAVASITISIGIAEQSGDLPGANAVIEAADRALYRAKETGRNRICR